MIRTSKIYPGHSSRIWNAKLRNQDKYAVSVGEGTGLYLWDLDQHENALIERLDGHEGKHVWTVSVSPRDKLIVIMDAFN